MTITRIPTTQLIINIYDTAIEEVKKFKYLASYITSNVDSDAEITHRTSQIYIPQDATQL